MNVGKIYTIRLVGNPNMAMDPLPLDLNSPCMKNKCMRVKKYLEPKSNFDHDYMVDILNSLDGSMDMPNVKIMSNMFEPKLFKGKRSSKKKKGKKTKKIKIKSVLDLLPDEILSDPSFKFVKKKSKSKKKKSIKKSKRSSKKKKNKKNKKNKSKRKSKKNKSFIF